MKNGLGRLTATLIYLITAIFLTLMSEMPSYACCDGVPKPEIFVQSPNKKYAALITPRYYVQTIGDFTLDIYQDNVVLTLFQQRNTKANYKSVWKMNIPDPGSDFINLVVTDKGCILVVLESYHYSPDNNVIQLYNSKAENVLSYPRSILLTYLNVSEQIRFSDLTAKASNNRIEFHDGEGFLFAIDGDNGEIITGRKR